MLDPSFLNSVNTDILPDADATRSLGSSTLRWLNAYLSGNLTVSSLTSGSVLFAGSGGLVSQDNANLFWDNTNKRLGIGTASPGAKLDVNGENRATQFTNAGALGTNAGNARNHFVQYNAGSAAIKTGWIAAAFGDTSGNRVVIGQADGKAYIAGHSGNLDAWADLSLQPYGTGNIGIGTTSPAEKLTLLSTGKIGWEASAGVVDTNLYRSAADVLKTDDSLVVGANLYWGTGAFLRNDQGGSIELGDSLATGVVPYIDFHYGTGAAQDYNIRLINDASGRLHLKGGGILVDGYGNLGSLQIGGLEVLTSARVLYNIASISQTLSPTSDGSYDLGSTTLRWRNGYFSAGIDVGDIRLKNGITITEDGEETVLKVKGRAILTIEPDGGLVIGA